jgi:uncharacterized membrane protein YjjP (DUF1212 family)
MLEWGANARSVHDAISNVSLGLGCDSSEAFCQHAAIIVMLRRGEEGCAQMGKVGEHGVNLRRMQMLQEITFQVRQGRISYSETLSEIESIPKNAKSYPLWFVCAATGMACSAFGRLLNSDWNSLLPIMIGAAAGQWMRHVLVQRGYNVFLIAGVVSFSSSSLTVIGAKIAGSNTIQLAMVSAVLLLIPGVPVLNAQIDVIEGKPNLAVARALRITFLLLFMALGLSLARSIFL